MSSRLPAAFLFCVGPQKPPGCDPTQNSQRNYSPTEAVPVSPAGKRREKVGTCTVVQKEVLTPCFKTCWSFDAGNGIDRGFLTERHELFRRRDEAVPGVRICFWM